MQLREIEKRRTSKVRKKKRNGGWQGREGC